MGVKLPFLILALIFLSARAGAGMSCEERFEPHPTLQDIKGALSGLKAEDQAHLYDPGTSVEFDSDQFGYVEKIRDSYESPQPLYNLIVPQAGGAVLYHGNIFVEGYFRHMRVEQFQNLKKTTELIQIQPWLKWHPDSKTYSFEHGGSQAVLLKNFVQDGKLKMFRGLRPHEADALRKAKAGDAAALSGLFTPHHDAIFFTTDEEAAKKWAQGYYIEVTVDPSEFDDLYAGIETNYVEIAIPSPELLGRALRGLKFHRFGVRPSE